MPPNKPIVFIFCHSFISAIEFISPTQLTPHNDDINSLAYLTLSRLGLQPTLKERTAYPQAQPSLLHDGVIALILYVL
jgi:hypothetical protein